MRRAAKILILVVDASPARLANLCAALEKHGFDTLSTGNGIMALQLAKQKKPNIVLACTRLDLMSIMQLYKAFQQEITLKRLPLVVYEDAPQAKTRQDALRRTKIAAYVRHPALPVQILPVIQNLEQALDLEERNTSLSHTVDDYILQLGAINASAQKFVPSESLKLLGRANLTDVKQGDWKRIQLAILFTDIRGFTTLSETMTPEDNFRFINAYLARMGPIIRKHRGFIDQYIGDGIMALFPKSAADAVSAALAMQKSLTVYNRHRARCGYPPIRIGIGIHFGDTIIGTIGENERWAVTVISDAVNVASRLETLTKEYSADIIISGTVAKRLSRNKLSLRPLGKVQVKGKTQQIEIYAVSTKGTPRLKTKALS